MLELQNISKSFPGVKALEQVSITFNRGEVHALCGENGAGKSTLMNIVAGNTVQDSGTALFDGHPVENANIQSAQKRGISIVYQERSLVDSLSVAENIFPVNQPRTKLGLIDFSALYAKTGELLKELQLSDIAPQTKVERLSTAAKQMVEIAKALAREPSLLILDEPTASITSANTHTLFEIIRRLKTNNVAVIYISHRMAEIHAIADVISVLKDGRFQGTFPTGRITIDELVTKMVGRELMEEPYRSHRKDLIALEARNISGKGFKEVSFSIRQGEILGFAGLQGSGRTELAEAIFGHNPISSGLLLKDGLPVRIRNPRDAVANGIAYVPDDRKSKSLFMDRSISDNIISTSLKAGLYRPARNTRIAESLKTILDIRTPSVAQLAVKLSGGNQQKVALAKWLNIDPDILIFNEPTHGVDIGAKSDIYRELKKLTAGGKSILLISSELTELLLVCDRIAVMFNGTIRKVIDHNEAGEEVITTLASGV